MNNIRILRNNILADALYNTNKHSGASIDYARGIVVGCVSALMSTGLSFKESWRIVSCNLPKNLEWRVEAVPESWLDELNIDIDKD